MLGTKIAELMDFPSSVSFKVVGKGSEAIQEGIKEVLEKNNVTDFALDSRESRNGTYTSYSVTLQVHSPEQMEKLYKELAQIDQVLMVI
ncbi:HP0495 family protein [Psittacicella hinzii]|nr:DUF493 family protein [Psittacicella hinzii]